MTGVITDYKNLAAYINENVSDENAMHLLTGMPEADPRDLKNVAQMYRFLQVAFVAAYCKWLKKGAPSSRQEGHPHAANAASLFELLYKVEPYNLDVIIYCLTEAKRDTVSNKDSLYHGILSTEPREYSRYYGIVYEWKNRLAGSGHNNDTIFLLVSNLITDLVFLKDFAVTRNGRKICLRIDGELYDAYDVLYEDDTGAWYILKERSTYGDSKYLTYVNLDDYSEMSRIVKY